MDYDNQGMVNQELKDYIRQFEGEEVLFCPNPGNAGDSAIAVGAYNLFDEFDVEYDLIPYNKEVDSNGRIVFYGGGGNLSKAYSGARQFINYHHKRSKRLILLPHTIDGQNDLIQKMGKNVDIFCREKRSYNEVQTLKTDAEVFLADDLAFNIEPKRLLGSNSTSQLIKEIALKIAKSIKKKCLGKIDRNISFTFREGPSAVQEICKSKLGNDTLYALRTDHDMKGAPVPDDNVDLSLLFSYGVQPEKSAIKSTKMVLQYMSNFNRIVTSRLHGCVLGAVLGKKVDFYSNNYYKNKAVYEFSIRDRFSKVNWCGVWNGKE